VVPEPLAFLAAADPEVIEQQAEAAVLRAFRSAAAEVPAYRHLLKARGVDPDAITDIAAFRSRVPTVDKAIFSTYRIDQMCRGGSLAEMTSVIPSSGSSGVFGFNVQTTADAQLGAEMADWAFEYCLRISQRRTLLVNAYPMGLQVPTKLPVANTGVNADAALAIVKAFGPRFDQLVVVAQPLFAKRLVEEGRGQNVDWASLRTTIVTGGEGFVESWRSYMAQLVGIPDADRPADALIASTMGVGELGINLFHEIPETIPIIRRAYRDAALRRALFGDGPRQCPHLFVYYPMRTFVEELPIPGQPLGELAVTMAGPDSQMPLLRYRTGDLARRIPYRTLEAILARHAPDLAPPKLRLPLVAVFGRERDRLEVAGVAVTPEAVKEALFRDFDVAQAATGFFKMSDAGGRLGVDAQLRPGLEATTDLRGRLAAALAVCCPDVRHVVRLFPFDAFPHEIGYERKYPYVSRRAPSAHA
jgi:phenylacetate-coenzyme A ligase PaaK-like adenylate-forming protein